METKICNVCGEEKEISAFSKGRKKCKKCINKATVLRRQKSTRFCKGCNQHKTRESFIGKNFLCVDCKPNINTGLKRCSSCKGILPIDNFYKDKSIADGYSVTCIECASNYHSIRKERFTVNSVNLSLTKICKQCNEEKTYEDFYPKVGCKDNISTICKECHKMNMAEYRLNHPEVMLEYRKNNKESLSRKSNEYNKANREHVTKVYREYRRRNKEYFREYDKRRYHNNPEPRKALSAVGRSRRKNAEGIFTYTDIAKLFFKQQGKCVYCGEELVKGQHIDHIMPLSKGGTNWPDNLQLLCPTCNLRKNAKLPEVYEAEIGFDRQAYEEKIAA